MSGGLRGALRALFGRKAPEAAVKPEETGAAAGSLFGTSGLALQAEAVTAVSAVEQPEPAAADQAEGLHQAVLSWRAYHVMTVQGGFVAAPGGSALVVDASVADAVVAIVPDAAPMVCLLLARMGGVLSVAGDPRPDLAMSARLLPTDVPGAVRLKYPVAGARFLALHAQSPGEPAGLRFDMDGNSMQAVFRLEPLAAEDVPALLHAVADEAALGAHRLAAAPLLRLLGAGRVRAGLAEPLIRLLPEDELAALARLATDDPAVARVLGQLLAGDRWAAAVLPALGAWQADRAAVQGHAMASPEADEAVLQAPSGGGVVTAGLALVGLARRQILPRRGACLLASARNEGPYLLEWLAYHLSIGFEHAFIYSNENEDGSDALLALLARHGVITLVRNERSAGMGPQLKGYTHALTLLPQILDYRWAALLDLDEYLGFDVQAFGTVGGYLGMQESQRVDAIALCWLMFAALPEDRWSAAPSLTRLTLRESEVNAQIKSVIRPNRFWYSQPHFPTATLDANFDYRSADGGVHAHRYSDQQRLALAPAPAAEQAWVNHYILRTAEEALWKWSRGRGDLAMDDPERLRPLGFIADTFLKMARPEHLVRDCRVAACAAGQAAMLGRLRALPGVAACEAEIVDGFGRQLALNARRFVERGPPADASVAVRGFYEIVKEGLVP